MDSVDALKEAPSRELTIDIDRLMTRVMQTNPLPQRRRV